MCLLISAGFAGGRLIMMNHRPPSPVSNPAPQLPQVMQFRVGRRLLSRAQPSFRRVCPGARPTWEVRSIHATSRLTRSIRRRWNGSLNLNAVRFDDPITETPQVGTIEDWVYINMTGDTHPMHSHLVTFQVVGRTPFDVEAYEEAYGGPNGVPGGIDPTPFATGPMQPPDPTERGFKDTVKANPESSPQSGRSMICRLALARRRPTFITATSSNTRTTT